MKMNVLRWATSALVLLLTPLAWASTPIQAEELLRRLGDGKAPLILDVRTPEEYAEGHIPGAVLVPHDQIDDYRQFLQPLLDQEVVVYCRSGRRAEQAVEALQGMGASRLRMLDGHWQEWAENAHPHDSDDSDEDRP